MANRARIQYQLGIIQVQLGLTQVQVQLQEGSEEVKKMVDRGGGWLRPERRRRFGLYDQLMVELQPEGEGLFVNFMRMPPEMFDELLLRVGTPHNQANLVPKALGVWTETGNYTESFGFRCKLP